MVFRPTEEQALKSLAYTRSRSTNTNAPAKKPIAISKVIPMKISKGAEVKAKTSALEQEPMIKAQSPGNIDNIDLQIKGTEVQPSTVVNSTSGKLQKSVSSKTSKITTSTNKIPGSKSITTSTKPPVSISKGILLKGKK